MTAAAFGLPLPWTFGGTLPPPPSSAPPWVSTAQARAIPGFSRAMALIAGMLQQMPMEAYRGPRKQSQPRLLAQPDPTKSRAWFVEQQVSDYLAHGNAVHWITSRLSNGLPSTVAHCPAERVNVWEDPSTRRMRYAFDGVELPVQDVVHLTRGQDPLASWRGVGVIEQHMSAWARMRDQEQAERTSLTGSGVPSVVVIAPNADLSKTEADAAKSAWVDTYSGPDRVPAVLPKGTEVKPLAWSPHDAQMVEARELSLKDVSNAFNLDSYWLGASAGSYTYRSPGPMYIHLMRQTVGPIRDQIEGHWGPAWLPLGQDLRFATQAVLGDDMGTTITWLHRAVSAGLLTVDEAREYLGKEPIERDIEQVKTWNGEVVENAEA